MGLVLAAHLGASTIMSGIVDENGRLLERHACPLPAPERAGSALPAVVALLDRHRPFDRFLACGIGVVGPLGDGGSSGSSRSVADRRSIQAMERLADHTGLRTAADNDARAFALAEGWVGAAVGERNYLTMVVSAGIGGGIVLDGRLVDGETGNAGAVGQMVAAWPGRNLPGQVCGVLDAEASGSAIRHHSGRPAREARTALVADTGRAVGRVAGSVVNVLDLRLVTIGGPVALGLGEPFFSAVRSEVDRVCRAGPDRPITVTPTGCGDEGPLIGAAAVALRRFEPSSIR